MRGGGSRGFFVVFLFVSLLVSLLDFVYWMEWKIKKFILVIEV